MAQAKKCDQSHNAGPMTNAQPMYMLSFQDVSISMNLESCQRFRLRGMNMNTIWRSNQPSFNRATRKLPRKKAIQAQNASFATQLAWPIEMNATSAANNASRNRSRGAGCRYVSMTSLPAIKRKPDLFRSRNRCKMTWHKTKIDVHFVWIGKVGT